MAESDVPDDRPPLPPPPPTEPAPAIVIVLGEKVTDGKADSLDQLVEDNLDLLAPLREFLSRNKAPRVTRVVTAITVDELLEIERQAVDSDFPPVESLSRYWRIDVTGLRDEKTPEHLVEEVLAPERDRPVADRGVARAYVESAAENPGSPGTPAAIAPLTVQSGQGWLRPGPEGVNAWAAWDHLGGHGEGIGIIDVEQGWQFTHPDVDGLAGTKPLVHLNRFDESVAEGDHGTSVLGIVVGRTNGHGGTGIAPRATVRTCSHYDGSPVMRTVDAILVARKELDPGDVLLLEVHLPHMSRMCAEADDATFHAIRLASAYGLVVVEAAGNGFRDISEWASPAGRRLSRDVPDQDSGAILVAGANPAVTTDGGTTEGHSLNRNKFSNHGRRVDCYAWGEGVQAPTAVDRYHEFDGTSAAAAIIAGVAAAVQGMRVAAHKPRLRARAMRTLLRDTPGTGQVPLTSTLFIGVMPDLGALATAVGAIRAQVVTGNSTVSAVPDRLESNS